MSRTTRPRWVWWMALLPALANADNNPPRLASLDGPEPLLDRVHRDAYDVVWRSAMHLDHLFGAQYGEEAYQGINGSLAPALLWDEFKGFQPRFRFNLNVPLPRLNERFYAFIGRVDPDEYVSERAESSGAFSRQYGPRSEDETLLGISYRDREKSGGNFDAGAGMRLSTPLDPYVKGSYTYQLGVPERLSFNIRETAFWQHSEQFGVTTRFDFERLFAGPWLVRWTNSGTFSQQSRGLRGYSSLMGLRGLSEYRAIAVAVGFDGEMDAPVPLHDYGIKFAYRQGIARRWLVLEVRTSLTWPKEVVDAPRAPSWGVGLGLEMLFGTEEFLARPVTF